MNRTRLFLILISWAFVELSPRGAHAHLISDECNSCGSDAPLPEEFRSAYLLRFHGTDREVGPASIEQSQARLQTHFDAVLRLLITQTPDALEIALTRLERRLGEAWSPAEREGWRRTLAARRFVQLRRLRLYQLRGRFPINEHVADRAVPVFVDHYDTACAVGHLMRESGWGAAVAQIEATNNLVYVTDEKEGRLVEWVLQSGLTQEEAALIQPAYDPPPFDMLLSQVVPNGGVSHAGLSYANFQFIGGPLTAPQLFPQTPPLTNMVNLAAAGVAARDSAWESSGNFLSGLYNDWLFVGGRNFGGLVSINSGDWGVIYSYDVVPTNANKRISAASIESIPNFTFNTFSLGGRIDVDTTIASPTVNGIGLPYHPSFPVTTVATMHFDTTTGGSSGLLFGHEARSFVPSDWVRVVTAVRVHGPANFTALVHSFAVVPEPGTAAMALVSCLILFGTRQLNGQSRWKTTQGACS